MIEVRELESSHLVEGVHYTRSVNPLYDTEDYRMVEEVVNGILFYHIDIFNFSPSVYKHLKGGWEQVKINAAKDGWDAVYSYTQNHSYVKKFGGEMVAKVISLTGDCYGVYKWELK
jgi:hypothetical protein